jgi:hypothetical protein
MPDIGLYNVLQSGSNRSAFLSVEINMKKAFSNILLASLLATTVTFAQSPQRKVDFLTRLLTLTTAQQQQATTIFTSSAADATVRTNLQTAHQSLTDAVKSNNSAAIDQAAATIGSLTAQVTSSNAKADAAFYQILTADQKDKYAQTLSEGPGGRFGPGRFGRGAGAGAGGPHQQ